MTRRSLALLASAVIGASAVVVPLATASSVDLDTDDVASCQAALTANTPLARADRRACVITIAATYLGAEQGTVAPGDAALAPDAVITQLGQEPRTAADQRAEWAAATDAVVITNVEWTVDTDQAFAAYEVRPSVDLPPTHHVAARFSLQAGWITDVLENPTTSSSAYTADNEPTPDNQRQPARDQVALAGRVLGPVDMWTPDHDDPAYCTLVLAEHGDESLTAEQERRCLIAIADSYVAAEGNTADDTTTIFDPRFAKYSLGGIPLHHPANGDLNRMDQIYLSPTIRHIDNKQWTVDIDTDEVWIVYDGYLPANVDKPGFLVAERISIRNGLIWEIMISPVVVAVPDSLVPGGGAPAGV